MTFLSCTFYPFLHLTGSALLLYLFCKTKVLAGIPPANSKPDRQQINQKKTLALSCLSTSGVKHSQWIKV